MADTNLERLIEIFPQSRFVKIAPLSKDMETNKELCNSDSKRPAQMAWREDAQQLKPNEAIQLAERGYRLGWIVPKGYAVIDVDNHFDRGAPEEMLKLVQKLGLKCCWNRSTNGVHILFKDEKEKLKSNVKKHTTLNVEIDIRANKTGYIVLPTNDIHRKWGTWQDSLEEVPYYFKPLISAAQIKDYPSFIGLKEGDGRNDLIWKWYNTVLKQFLSNNREQRLESVKLINENLFAIPMSANEFATCTRDKDDQVTGKQKKAEKLHGITESILDKEKIICLGKQFYIYTGTYYKPMDDLQIEQLIYKHSEEILLSGDRAEILGLLRCETLVSGEELNQNTVQLACGNGVIDLRTARLVEANPMDYNTVFIPWNYIESPIVSPIIDTFMNDITGADPLLKKYIYEVLGYCLLKDNRMEKIFIFQGQGGTGKSTLLNLAQVLATYTNCSFVKMQDFESEYHVATLLGKLINIEDDDNSDGSKRLENGGMLKSIISGNTVQARQIYKAPVAFKPFCTCIIACNKLPRISDKSSGMFRRLAMVKLDHVVKNPIKDLVKKIENSKIDMEYLLSKSVQGIQNVLESGKFSIEESEAQLLSQFKCRQSIINEWVYEQELTNGDFYHKVPSAMYALFADWCQMNGYNRRPGMFTFKEDICALFNFVLSNDELHGAKQGMPVFHEDYKIDPTSKKPIPLNMKRRPFQ